MQIMENLEGVQYVRHHPYSPELNAVEKLWDCLRDHLCNRKWDSLEQWLTLALT